jgi:hypothetical protein
MTPEKSGTKTARLRSGSRGRPAHFEAAFAQRGKKGSVSGSVHKYPPQSSVSRGNPNDRHAFGLAHPNSTSNSAGIPP